MSIYVYQFTQILRKVVYMFQYSAACGSLDPQLSNCQPSICQLMTIFVTYSCSQRGFAYILVPSQHHTITNVSNQGRSYITRTVRSTSGYILKDCLLPGKSILLGLRQLTGSSVQFSWPVFWVAPIDCSRVPTLSW